MKLGCQTIVTAFAAIVIATSASVDTFADRGKTRVSKEVKDRASAYFSKGEMLFENKEYAKAAEAFQLAYDTLPHPAALVNLARCYEKAGRIGDAVAAYRRFLLETHDFEGIKVRDVKEKLAKLEPKVGELAISCELENCQIRVDGIARGDAPLQLLLKTGTHKVEALIRGRVEVVRECSVRSNSVTAVELRAPRDDASAPHSAPDAGSALEGRLADEKSERGDPLRADVAGFEEEDRTPLGVPFWIAAGATVAAGGAAAAVGIRLIDVKSDFNQAQAAQNFDVLDELSQKGRRLQILTNVFFGVTGALALTSATLAVIDLVGHKKKNEAIGLCPGPGLGLGAFGRF